MSRSPPHPSVIMSRVPKEMVKMLDCSMVEFLCVSLSGWVWSSWDLLSVKSNGIFS